VRVQVPHTYKTTSKDVEGRGRSLPNFVVEWVTLLLSIQEVPGSNLGPEIGNSEVSRRLSYSLEANDGIVS
jgi:hypothetical protein